MNGSEFLHLMNLRYQNIQFSKFSAGAWPCALTRKVWITDEISLRPLFARSRILSHEVGVDLWLANFQKTFRMLRSNAGYEI